MSREHPREIAERFQVISILGEGGIGVVYKAHDPILNKTVAIKLLKDGLPPSVIVRFQQEAKAVGKLNHRNIIDVYDFGIADGTPYLVIEFLEGESLSDYMNSEQWHNLKLVELLDIHLQICRGLIHAHKRHVLHRDIKPSNVMLKETDSEEAKKRIQLVDFGLAKLGDEDQSLTATGATMGSPLYMSPEQVGAEEIKAPSDVYSFGCVMYETLCGSPPFMGESASETMIMHRKQPLEPIVTRIFNKEEIPMALIDLIEKCLEKEPQDRPSLEEIGLTLEGTMHTLEPELVIEEERDEPFKVLSSEILTQRSVLGTGAVVILIGLIVFSVLYFTKAAQQETEKLSKETKDKAFVRASKQVSMLPNYKVFARYEFRYEPENARMVGSQYMEDEDVMQLTKKKEKIEQVVLTNSLVKGSTLWALKNMDIEYLSLAHSKLNDKGLKNVALIKSLRNLDISSCEKISNRGIAYLKELPKLTALSFKGENITDQTMKIVGTMSKLVELYAPGPCQISDKGLAYLTKLKRLNILNLSGARLSDQGFKALLKFPKLNQLYLKNVNLQDKHIPILTKIKLYGLDISGNQSITSSGFKELKKLGRIDTLNLAGTNLDDNGLEHILTLKPKFLDVAYTDISRRGLKMISECKSINSLDLGGLNLVDNDMRMILPMKLTSLDIKQNQITAKGLMMMTSMKSLQQLRLKGRAKDDFENKDNPGINGSDVEQFRKQMPNCKIHR